MKRYRQWLAAFLTAGGILAACSVKISAAEQFHFLDLSAHQVRTWDTFALTREWSPPAGGVQTFNDVTFELAGPVQFLGLAQARRNRLHSMAADFPVNRRFTQAHLLHFTLFGSPVGQPVAAIIFHYEEGDPYQFPLRHGFHFLDWYQHRAGRPVLGRTTTGVWMAPMFESPERSQVSGMWHTILPNPHPEREVRKIEIKSMFHRAGYTLAALTLEQGRPMSALEEQGGHFLPPLVFPPQRELRLVDAETGEPVNGGKATVWLRQGEQLLLWGDHEIDADGVLTFPVPPDGSYAVELIAAGMDHVPTRFTLSAHSGLSVEKPLKMKRGRRIGGEVRDQAGQPVAGASVAVSGVMPGPDGDFVMFGWPAVRSDEEGRWSIGAAPENFRNLSLSVSHPEFQPAVYEQWDDDTVPYVVSTAKLAKGEAGMELSRGANLEGRVVDTAGNPIANARVAYFAGHDIPGVQRRVATDAKGRFEMLNLRPGHCALIVSAPGHAAAVVRRGLVADQEPWLIELKPSVPLRLKLVDGQRRPVSGAYVLLPEWQGLRWNSWMQSSDKDGMITWAGAPLEQTDYFITGPGVRAKVVALKPGEDIHIVAVERAVRSP